MSFIYCSMPRQQSIVIRWKCAFTGDTLEYCASQHKCSTGSTAYFTLSHTLFAKVKISWLSFSRAHSKLHIGAIQTRASFFKQLICLDTSRLFRFVSTLYDACLKERASWKLISFIAIRWISLSLNSALNRADKLCLPVPFVRNLTLSVCSKRFPTSMFIYFSRNQIW